MKVFIDHHCEKEITQGAYRKNKLKLEASVGRKQIEIICCILIYEKQKALSRLCRTITKNGLKCSEKKYK